MEDYILGSLAYYIPFGIAFLASVLAAPFIIPALRRLKFGQSIREIGPSWHKGKSGTPTMGGIIFIIGVFVAALISSRNRALLIVLFTALGFGLIGFLDDYIKVVLKRNLGLTSWQKLLMQIAVSVIFMVVITGWKLLPTEIIIPFVSNTWNLGWLFVPFSVFIMVGFVNAVNLTDGLDGLASLITAIVSLFFAIVSFFADNAQLTIFCIALTGGCLGFYMFNRYPAKVFMGDTGSLFLGGALAAVAIMLKMPLIIIIAGIIYVVETLSVMMQVTSFKLTGKRIFKMSPIHHHFEMIGWSENKIAAVFGIVSIAACIIAFFAAYPTFVINV